MENKKRKKWSKIIAAVMTFSMMLCMAPGSMITSYAQGEENIVDEITTAVDETTEEVTEDTTEEITEDTTEEITEETTEDTTEEITEEITEESTEELLSDQAYTPNYLTFTAVTAGSKIAFSWKSGSNVQYSIDGGTTWKSYTAKKVITLANKGDTVKFRGKNVVTGSDYDENGNETIYNFVMTGKISASGSVTSLTDANGGNANVTLSDACYSGMFYYCKSLVKAPALPAKTMTTGCYMNMFEKCTSLTKTPALPATVLADGCYSNMFKGCTSLVNVQSLPATTMAYHCYYDMFGGCISLVDAPNLPATTLAHGCYAEMFWGCDNLINAPALPATTLAESCYESMFFRCKSLVKAPTLSATALAANCYSGMFQNCTNLTEVQAKLPATTLKNRCYNGMFLGCSSLENAPVLPAKTLADNCYSFMFADCSKLIKAPALPATKLYKECYYYMFSGCKAFEACPTLPATTMAQGCYQDMFSGCISIKEGPELPATTLANDCYSNMFARCTNLEKAPELIATTLKDRCYYAMFSGCKKLGLSKYMSERHNLLWRIPAKESATDSLKNMFKDCPGVEFVEPELNYSYCQQSWYCEHQYEKTIVKKGTPTTDGYYSRVCKICKEKGKDVKIYAASKVSLAATEYTYTGNAIKPAVVVKNSKGNTISTNHYTVSYTNNVKVGKATVTITFKGYYTGKVTKTFIINPKGTSIKSLTPRSNAIRIDWYKQDVQVTHYYIMYSANSNFSNAKVISVPVGKVGYTLSNLKSNQTYYFKIRTERRYINKAGETIKYKSKWSKIVSSKAK